MISIFFAIIILVGLWFLILHLLPYALAGKQYFVRSVATGRSPRLGQIQLWHDKLRIKTLWRKDIDLAGLQIIEGYLETTPGLEEICCVDLIFSNGRKICLDGSKPDQQELINQILLMLHAESVNWNTSFGAFSSDKTVVYQASATM